MKKINYLSALIIFGLFFVSCEKPEENEWNKYYGYSNEEIAGTYSFSNISDAFDGLTESAYCHICEDATINITAASGSGIEFKVNCPNETFSRTFEGKPRVDNDDFLINLTAPSWGTYPDYELTVSVYKNDQGDTRLHGFARRIIYEVVTNPNGITEHRIKSKINYYFDVIKN